MRQAVHEYVKKKRGLYAADGGEVPEDEAELEEEEGDAVSPPEMPAAAPSPAVPASQADLEAGYSKAADGKAVDDASAKAQWKNRLGGVMQGLEQIATARGVANGMKADDGSFYEGLRKQNQQNIAQAQGQRENSIQDFLRKNAITRQVVDDAYKSNDEERKAKAQRVVDDANTADSVYSKGMQEHFSKLWDVDASKLSATQMHELSAQYEKKAKIDESKAAAELRAETAKANREATAARLADTAQRKQEHDDSRADRKAEDDSAKAYTTATNLASGGRGAPQNVQIAAKNQTAVKNAEHILAQAKKGPDGKPDYNSLNSTQIALLNAEVARIAQQGAPTEASQAHLDPGTFAEGWSKFVQSVKGQPNGAQLGEFVQQNADYLKGLKEVADGVMRDHRKNVYEGASVHFTPDHDKRWRDAHPEDFEPDAPAHEEAPPPAPPQGGPGMAVGAPAKVYKDGETKVIGGVTYTRQGGAWHAAQ